MTESDFNTIEQLLASTIPDDIREGLKLVRARISKVSSDEAERLVDMVSTLFYVDAFDHPELALVVDEAISVVADSGKSIIPTLLKKLDAGDFKAQIAIAQALGRMGSLAIQPLISEYHYSGDPTRRSFILYALGKITSIEIVQAAQIALDATESMNLELRDTATRALGKFAESIPPSNLSDELRRDFIEKLQKNLAFTSPGIRAKAIRSLGKLAKYGHLNSAERETLKKACQRILGKDENYEWDRAYIVRKEAEEALRYTTT